MRMKYSYLTGSVAVIGPAPLHVRDVMNTHVEMIDLQGRVEIRCRLLVGIAGGGSGPLMTPESGMAAMKTAVKRLRRDTGTQ